MNLPDGVVRRPREDALIAKAQPALIRIEGSPRFPANDAYDIKDRLFENAVGSFLRGDWEDFDRRYGLRSYSHASRGDIVYSGAEHRGSPKLPNITVVPNLAPVTLAPGIPTVFGCTMGHYHPSEPGGPRIQEVYEFQSYGLLALDRETGWIELWVARDGDKVAVPNACHMMLYNLDDERHPLITLDFADPARNGANKDMVGKHGPVLLAYYDDSEVVYRLNREYLNSPHHSAGARFAAAAAGEQAREVRIGRGTRLGLGALLYERLTSDPDVIGQFARLGIRIRQASPEAVPTPLAPGSGTGLHFSRPLASATAPGTEVSRYFLPETPPATTPKPGGGHGKGITALEAEITAEKEALIDLPALNRPLVIVIEGAGDWVEKTYRKLFMSLNDPGGQVSVFYADDTSWKGRPEWTLKLEPWEVYLDKADPADFEKYRNLRPDVVFIVTPDFTHSAIARWWLGKTPLVFVEKPFDSEVANVERLLRDLGKRRGTTVLGLDHYQFYALPIHDLKQAVVDHLSGALAGVVFYLTEENPIELGRERSLQHGLTLDLLPHFLALLTYLGDVETLDEIRVIEARQYDPLIARDPKAVKPDLDLSGWFRNETYSRIRFTLEDYSGNGYRVPCTAVVGKGLSQGVKYVEFIGLSGDAVRVDLNKKPDPDPSPGYPWDSLFFLYGGGSPLPAGVKVLEMPDPYDSTRVLRILDGPRYQKSLERQRYNRLLDDLIRGTKSGVASALLLTEALPIVEALDRIWLAVQAAKASWARYPLNQLTPVRADDVPQASK